MHEVETIMNPSTILILARSERWIFKANELQIKRDRDVCQR